MIYFRVSFISLQNSKYVNFDPMTRLSDLKAYYMPIRPIWFLRKNALFHWFDELRFAFLISFYTKRLNIPSIYITIIECPHLPINVWKYNVGFAHYGLVSRPMVKMVSGFGTRKIIQHRLIKAYNALGSWRAKFSLQIKSA